MEIEYERRPTIYEKLMEKKESPIIIKMDSFINLDYLNSHIFEYDRNKDVYVIFRGKKNKIFSIHNKSKSKIYICKIIILPQLIVYPGEKRIFNLDSLI